MKVAYFSEPQLGGTFTFFQRLRPALANHGVDFHCISTVSASAIRGTQFDLMDGVDVLPLGNNLADVTKQMIEHLQKSAFDIAMVLPAADIASSNLPRYLPRTIRCVMRVPMMTRGAYAPAKAVAGHLNMIHAVSDRINNDLTGRYSIPKEQVTIIYHGVDPIDSPDSLAAKSSSGTVRLLYAGRLWDTDKGVFLLPDIMERLCLAEQDVQLTIAGGGPDAQELKRRFERAGVMDRVVMTGPLPLEKMNDYYAAADVFIFPSRFEGCGFAVLEAMAAGCAPVVSDIRGSLRVLVDDGYSGQLARVGDPAAFAQSIIALTTDRNKLREFQQKAQQRVRDRFTLDRMAAEYAESFKHVLTMHDLRQPVLSISNYVVPDAFRPTWRTWIPRPIKNIARTWMERRGISS